MFSHFGIDWGQKRIGLAVGDSQTGLVLPLNYELNPDNIFEILQQELQQKGDLILVVGIPTNFKLQKTKTSYNIENFLLELKTKFPQNQIVTINENNSTKIGQKNLYNQKDKVLLNHQAACVILQTYFDFFGRN